MRCIFCKCDTTSSHSVEHIIPESLGNIEHTLPRGTVCDACNQYFASKVEGPVLTSGVFRFLRSRMNVPSKKGRIPAEPEEERFQLPEYRKTGRFLGKVGLEVLAARLFHHPDWESEVVDKPELDHIRDFARFDRGRDWPFAYRPIYRADSLFHDGQNSYEVLHEYDLLYTRGRELYIVVALFGVELALNLGGRELDGYNHWLEKHEFLSPLYVDKAAENWLDVPPVT
jgi:pterin-4a-carbinolamine dehydratase